MANYYNVPVLGIDVSANFSVVSVLSPSGDVYKKNIKFNHNLDGLTNLVNLTEKVEEEFGNSPKLFCESTGIYHLTLLHFIRKHQKDISAINPLISHSNKNWDIRKAKNDKRDSLSIARLCKLYDVKTSMDIHENLLHLRFLIREYYNRVDDRANIKMEFSNILHVYYPGFKNAFSDIYSKTALAFLEAYPTPQNLIDANAEEVIRLLRITSKSGLKWSKKKYHELLKIANEALILGLNSSSFVKKANRFIASHKFHTEIIDDLYAEINEYIHQADLGSRFLKDLDLLTSFKGLGRMAAITLLSVIGSLDNFSKPQQLVAFFGVDPCVNESGKFKGDKNKMSKRGSALGRRVLYAFALQCIRKGTDKNPINSTLHHYYHKQLKHKKKKVRVVAVMNKLLRYIFSVLKNQQPYIVRDPKIHKRMFLENNSKAKIIAA